MVDAPDLGSGNESCVGSSPICRTNHETIMKTPFFYILCFLTIVLCGCLDKTRSHYTPHIYISLLTTTDGDTLFAREVQDATYYRLDTCEIGDTISFVVAFDAVGNELRRTFVNWDKSDLSIIHTNYSSLKKVLVEPTDSASLDYYYQPLLSGSSLQLQVLPIKAGEKPVVFNVESDSKYSPQSLNIHFIVADTTTSEK